MAPYLDCISQGVSTIMASYSSWNGRKLHSDHFLLTEILKEKLGFKVKILIVLIYSGKKKKKQLFFFSCQFTLYNWAFRYCTAKIVLHILVHCFLLSKYSSC
jgi:hypothetical protein